MSLEVLDPTGGEGARRFLRKEYAEAARPSRATGVHRRVKPLLPRGLQLALRRMYLRCQAALEFPRSPIEPILVDGLHEAMRERIVAAAPDPYEFVWLWPEGHSLAVVMTRDVEGSSGIADTDRALEVERRSLAAAARFPPTS
jgi:hypothetical protein